MRPVRDLLRKRGQLVRERTRHILSVENLLTRNTGSRLSCRKIKDSIVGKSNDCSHVSNCR